MSGPKVGEVWRTASGTAAWVVSTTDYKYPFGVVYEDGLCNQCDRGLLKAKLGTWSWPEDLGKRYNPVPQTGDVWEMAGEKHLVLDEDEWVRNLDSGKKIGVSVLRVSARHGQARLLGRIEWYD